MERLSHLIDPATLRADDFASFYAARMALLAKLAVDAHGKSVPLDAGPVEGVADDDGDTLDELAALDEVA